MLLAPPGRGSTAVDLVIVGDVYLRWRRFTELLGPGSGICVEVGCGSGSHRRAVEALGYRYVGLDIRATEGAAILGDAHALPFADGCVDVIIAPQVLEHLQDPRLAVREAARVLKRGGVFCGSTSLLEPFHNSYCNFTHWGLAQLLNEHAGFERIRIEAGPNVALFIVYYFFDMLGLLRIGLKVSGPLTRFTFGLPLLLIRFLHRAKALAKRALRLGSPTSAVDLWSLHSLSWSGHLLFCAEKL